MAYFKMKLGIEKGEKSTFIYTENVAEQGIETLKSVFETEMLSAETTVIDGKVYVSVLIENEEKKQMMMDKAVALFREKCPEINNN